MAEGGAGADAVVDREDEGSAGCRGCVGGAGGSGDLATPACEEMIVIGDGYSCNSIGGVKLPRVEGE